jgi:hypothetical protein
MYLVESASCPGIFSDNKVQCLRIIRSLRFKQNMIHLGDLFCLNLIISYSPEGDSFIRIENRLRTDISRFETGQKQGIFLFYLMFGQAEGPIQAPIQLVPAVLPRSRVAREGL